MKTTSQVTYAQALLSLRLLLNSPKGETMIPLDAFAVIGIIYNVHEDKVKDDYISLVNSLSHSLRRK